MPKIELGFEVTSRYRQLGVAVEPGKHNGCIIHPAVRILTFQSSLSIEHRSVKIGTMQVSGLVQTIPYPSC